MGGHIWLDESYDSGIEGFPGASFVVDLNVAPAPIDEENTSPAIEPNGTVNQSHIHEPFIAHDDTSTDLPRHLSVLFTDDDGIIRRLFCRTLKLVAPEWNVVEASNGETALQLVKETNFDLIFMDNYMASTEKQLLGTETVRELRALGFEGRVCGLSANDIGDQFIAAGADAFMIKPFPCQKDAFEGELRKVLFGPS